MTSIFKGYDGDSNQKSNSFDLKSTQVVPHTLLLLEYTYTQRGFSCLLMKAIVSSTLFTERTGSTGPKRSCCIMGSDSSTSVKIVGALDRTNAFQSNIFDTVSIFIDYFFVRVCGLSPIYFSASVTCPPKATLPDLHNKSLVRLKMSTLTMRQKLLDSLGSEP